MLLEKFLTAVGYSLFLWPLGAHSTDMTTAVKLLETRGKSSSEHMRRPLYSYLPLATGQIRVHPALL